ncbi:MAG: type VI secretion system-associated FHA domain protein, partial [Casimicrobium sp.]
MIEIFVISYSGSAASASTSAIFDSAGGTIGRGAGNHLTLADPDRHLSRVQAKIVSLSASSFEVSNLSRANSMFVGTSEIEPQQRTIAQVGAELRMGLYVLGTRVTQGAARGASEGVGEALTPTVSATQSVPDPFAMVQVAPGATSANPFADILDAPAAASKTTANATPATRAPASARSAKSVGVSAPAAAATSMRIPDDFDPFSMPSAAARNSDNPIHDLAQSSDVSLRNVFEDSTHVNQLVDGSLAPNQRDNPQALFDDASSSLNDSVSSDPLALFGGGGARANNANDPFAMIGVGNQASELSSFLTLPKVETFEDAQRTPAAPVAARVETPILPPLVEADEQRTFELPPSPPAPTLAAPKRDLLAPTVSTASAVPPTKAGKSARATKASAPARAKSDDAGDAPPDALVRAFMEGAGVATLDIPDATDEEFMRRVGAMLRASIDGTVDLISARASTKREVRADVTMIVSRGNNPIKFAPDGEAAAMQLLGTPFPGFMPPVDSMQDAFDDLRAH